MPKNPYYYSGALELDRHQQVLVPREKDLNQVVEGIKDGHYWAILGPREVGKTTFLRQIENQLQDAHHIHFNLQVSPDQEEYFYQWLMEKLVTEISGEEIPIQWDKKVKSLSPKMKFLNFLESYGEVPLDEEDERASDNRKPKGEGRKAR